MGTEQNEERKKHFAMGSPQYTDARTAAQIPLNFSHARCGTRTRRPPSPSIVQSPFHEFLPPSLTSSILYTRQQLCKHERNYRRGSKERDDQKAGRTSRRQRPNNFGSVDRVDRGAESMYSVLASNSNRCYVDTRCREGHHPNVRPAPLPFLPARCY